MRTALLMLLFMPFVASAADDARLNFLEAEVRDLKRQVQSLTTQLNQLATRPARPGAMSAPPRPASPPAPASDPERWVDARKWNALRPGMSELEVLTSLGPPTSMREEKGARVLFYALEVGSSGFLGGSVTLRERVVAEIRKPTLQ